MPIFLPTTGEEERNKKESKKRWMGVNVVYTYTIKGWGCSKNSKRQKAAGLEQKAGSAGG